MQQFLNLIGRYNFTDKKNFYFALWNNYHFRISQDSFVISVVLPMFVNIVELLHF